MLWSEFTQHPVKKLTIDRSTIMAKTYPEDSLFGLEAMEELHDSTGISLILRGHSYNNPSKKTYQDCFFDSKNKRNVCTILSAADPGHGRNAKKEGTFAQVSFMGSLPKVQFHHHHHQQVENVTECLTKFTRKGQEAALTKCLHQEAEQIRQKCQEHKFDYDKVHWPANAFGVQIQTPFLYGSMTNGELVEDILTRE